MGRSETRTVLKAARVSLKSWVMTTATEDGFIKLPNEKVLYVSPPRTSLAISSPSSYPGTQPFSTKSEGGVAYVTNQRIVYLPTQPTTELQSFSSPILNLSDAFVHAPFFGANYWTAIVRPVAGGGIPTAHPYVELRMTFREGGAYDYHTTYEQIKERLHNAVSLAREEGRVVTGANGIASVDLANVHLEQLPAYEPTQHSPAGRHVGLRAEDGTGLSASVAHRDAGVGHSSTPVPPKSSEEQFQPPDEPPPGYAEAQAQALDNHLEQSLRDEAERS